VFGHISFIMKRLMAYCACAHHSDRCGMTKTAIMTKSVIYPVTKFVQTDAVVGQFGIRVSKVPSALHFVKLLA
jgi:hypothetical protein